MDARLVVKKSKIAGLGVFAEQDIKAGEVFLTNKVIVIKDEDPCVNWYGKSEIKNYTFYFTQRTAALALGFGSLFNHSDNNSAKSRPKPKDRELEFYATRDIKAGEEITITYSYIPRSKKQNKSLNK